MTTQETIAKYLSDMYALEHHVLQPIKAQASDEDFGPFPEAHALVQRIQTRTQQAIDALELQVKEFGGDVRGVKATLTAAAGAVAAVVNEGRTHKITKKLRDDYTALALVSVGYELLYTTANALGATKVAHLALTELKAVAGLIMQLSQIILPVAVRELAKTNPETNVSTVAESQAAIKDAWRSQPES